MTTTSITLQEIQKQIGEKAKADPHYRFWGLYTHVWKLNVLGEAYRLAKKNNGAPGVDDETFEQIEEQGLQQWLEVLSSELREKTYRPLPCRQVEHTEEGRQQDEDAENPGDPRPRGPGSAAPPPGADLRGGLPARLVRIPPQPHGAPGVRAGWPTG